MNLFKKTLSKTQRNFVFGVHYMKDFVIKALLLLLIVLFSYQTGQSQPSSEISFQRGYVVGTKPAYSITALPDGRVIYGGTSELFVIDSAVAKYITYLRYVLPENAGKIEKIFFDGSVIWLADGKALYKLWYDFSDFKRITDLPVVNFSMYQDKLLLITEDTLYITETHQDTLFYMLKFGFSYGLLSVASDNKNNIWLGTKKGVVRFNISTQDTIRWTFSDNHLGSNEIVDIMVDNCTGYVWAAQKEDVFGYPGGLLFYKDNLWNRVGNIPGSVLSLEIDRNGWIWFTTWYANWGSIISYREGNIYNTISSKSLREISISKGNIIFYAAGSIGGWLREKVPKKPTIISGNIIHDSLKLNLRVSKKTKKLVGVIISATDTIFLKLNTPTQEINWDIGNLSYGKYLMKITAVNQFGAVSDTVRFNFQIGKDGSVLLGPHLLSPENYTNFLDANSVKLTFTDIGASEYSIVLNDTVITVTTDTAYTLSGLKTGKLYKWYVVADSIVSQEVYYFATRQPLPHTLFKSPTVPVVTSYNVDTVKIPNGGGTPEAKFRIEMRFKLQLQKDYLSIEYELKDVLKDSVFSQVLHPSKLSTTRDISIVREDTLPVYYKIKFRAVDTRSGLKSEWSSESDVKIDKPPEPPPASVLPDKFKLYQNYPNPFNSETVIKYDVPGNAEEKSFMVEIVIYNLLGQPVRKLVDEIKEPGNYETKWDAEDSYGNPVSAGIYFYRLKTNEFTKTKKMLLIR